MKTILPFAALAAAVLAAPVQAQIDTTTNPPASVMVRHADLDLSTARDRNTLRHRIDRAVIAVCGDASGVNVSGRNRVARCRTETLAAAIPARDRLVASAQGSILASAVGR